MLSLSMESSKSAKKKIPVNIDALPGQVAEAVVVQIRSWGLKREGQEEEEREFRTR